MIVHVGFPRCGSTTVQRALAASDATFLGCDAAAPPGEFYDDRIGYLIEREMRLGGDEVYELAAAPVRSALSELDRIGDRPVVLSNENLCHRLTPWDLPTDLKLKRVGRLVPAGSVVVAVFRDIRDHLRSLHRNHLGLGYTGDLPGFLAELAVLGELATFGDLRLASLVERLRSSFVDPGLVLVDLDCRDSLRRLFEELGISVSADALDPQNRSVDDATTARMLAHNRAVPARRDLFDWLELHRMFPNEQLGDEYRFRASRDRHALTDAARVEDLAEPDSLVVDLAAEDWPMAVNALDQENRQTIAVLRGQPDVTVIDDV